MAVDAAVRGTTSVPDAIALCEGSLELHPDELRRNAYLRIHLAVLRTLSGDLDGAREAASAARSELEELGEELGLGTSALALLGTAAALSADWVSTQEIFEQGLEYTRVRPDLAEWHGYFLARLGEVALARADPETAAGLAERARIIGVDGDVETDVWWRRVAARASSATGHPRKALRAGREAVAIADGTDDVLLRSGARLDLAEVQLRAGRRTEALTLVREALELLDRKGALLPAAHARERFADLLAEPEGGGAAIAAPPEAL